MVLVKITVVVHALLKGANVVSTYPAGERPYEKEGEASRKIWNKSQKKIILDVAQGLFEP